MPFVAAYLVPLPVEASWTALARHVAVQWFALHVVRSFVSKASVLMSSLPTRADPQRESARLVQRLVGLARDRYWEDYLCVSRSMESEGKANPRVGEGCLAIAQRLVQHRGSLSVTPADVTVADPALRTLLNATWRQAAKNRAETVVDTSLLRLLRLDELESDILHASASNSHGTCKERIVDLAGGADEKECSSQFGGGGGGSATRVSSVIGAPALEALVDGQAAVSLVKLLDYLEDAFHAALPEVRVPGDCLNLTTFLIVAINYRTRRQQV